MFEISPKRNLSLWIQIDTSFAFSGSSTPGSNERQLYCSVKPANTFRRLSQDVPNGYDAQRANITLVLYQNKRRLAEIGVCVFG